MDNLQEIRSHFNEPVLFYYKVGIIVGLVETEEEPLLLVKYMGGDTRLYPSSNGYMYLDALKGQNKKISKDGEIWDDYTRLDLFLESNGCRKEPRFSLQRGRLLNEERNSQE